MFFTDKRFRQLTWLVHELIIGQANVEETMSANSDAIEAQVAALKDVEVRITAKLTALQAAVDNGEDLSGPLADLAAEVGTIGGLAPAAPAETPVDTTPPAAS